MSANQPPSTPVHLTPLTSAFPPRIDGQANNPFNPFAFMDPYAAAYFRQAHLQNVQPQTMSQDNPPLMPIATPAIEPTTVASSTANDNDNNENDENMLLRQEVEKLRQEVTASTELCKTLNEHVNMLHKAVTGDDREDDFLSLRPFEILKIRKGLILQIRMVDVGVKRVDVSKAFAKAIRISPTSNRGLQMVSFYTRKVYSEIFGVENLKHYSTTRKATLHTTRGAYIAVPNTLPEALVTLFCDAFGIVGDTKVTYFAVAIRTAVNEVVTSIFNNARRSVTVIPEEETSNAPNTVARKRPRPTGQSNAAPARNRRRDDAPGPSRDPREDPPGPSRENYDVIENRADGTDESSGELSGDTSDDDDHVSE